MFTLVFTTTSICHICLYIYTVGTKHTLSIFLEETAEGSGDNVCCHCNDGFDSERETTTV